MRGGWTLRGEGQRAFVHFDPEMYAGYQVLRNDGTIDSFQVPGMLSNLFGASVSVSTPTFRTFSGRIEAGYAESPLYPEAAAGRETAFSLTASLRPTDSVRVEATAVFSQLVRVRNGSEFARTVIPRLKMEYQPRRSLFFRIIGEYRSQRQASLEDPRTGELLIVDGDYSTPQKINGLRVDFLISYEPTPGTVAFFGYGSSLESDQSFGITDLTRTSDGFFLKLAYQFRR